MENLPLTRTVAVFCGQRGKTAQKNPHAAGAGVGSDVPVRQARRALASGRAVLALHGYAGGGGCVQAGGGFVDAFLPHQSVFRPFAEDERVMRLRHVTLALRGQSVEGGVRLCHGASC